MPKRINIASFSSEEVAAITTALPYVIQLRADTPAQDMLNQLNVVSAGQKLARKEKDFTPNELRVIYIAVSLAKAYLGGEQPLDLTNSEAASLRKHLFTFNSLYEKFYPYFQ